MLWPFVLLTSIALIVVLYIEYREAAVVQRQRPDQGAIRASHGTLFVAAIAKTFASLGFIGAAISAGALSSLVGQMLFIALVWSFIGDVLLVLRGSRIAFMFGIAAFLMAHLGYVMLFRLRGIDMSAFLIAFAAFALVAFFVWRWLAAHVAGAMRVAVAVYIAVITLMVACAVGTVVAVPGSLLPLVAACLFWLSDIAVARQRFVQRSFWNRAVGLPLYFAAQFLFVALI